MALAALETPPVCLEEVGYLTLDKGESLAVILIQESGKSNSEDLDSRKESFSLPTSFLRFLQGLLLLCNPTRPSHWPPSGFAD